MPSLATPPSPSLEGAMAHICDFCAPTRYATPNGKGYLPFAFIASHRHARRAAEGPGTAGFAAFFYNDPSLETTPAAATKTRPACRGCFFMREEKESIAELAELGVVASEPYLTLTAAPPSLLEEYLPLVKWWLPARHEPVTAAPKESTGANHDSKPTTRLQLFLRDATHGQQTAANALTEAAVARQRTYTALAIYNCVSLLSSLPTSRTFAGLTAVKLVSFPLSSLLWDAVAKAGPTLQVLNLAGCTGFTDPIAEEAMRQLGKGSGGAGGAAGEDGTAAGALPHLRALAFPASDATNATLRTLISATAPYFQLAYVNMGECKLITDISALVRLKGSLRCLHAYALPKLEASLAVEVIGRCGADSLTSLCLSRCPSIVEVKYLGRLKKLTRLDLQGCTGVRSLAGILGGLEGVAADLGCGALRRLWLTGCTALRLTAEDQQALFATCGASLEDLQLGYMHDVCTAAANGVFTLTPGSDSADATSPLRSLSFAECSSVRAIGMGPHGSVRFPNITMLDLSGTQLTTEALAAMLRRPAATPHTNEDGDTADETLLPALHTLALNGCRSISDFSCLRVPSLLRLSLAGTRVTAHHLEAVAIHCPRLQALNVSFCTDIASFHVFPLFRALRVLSVAHTSVSNSALPYLVNVPFLQILSLQGTAVTDVLRLAKAPYLRLVECGAKKAIKNVQQLTKAGVKVDTQAAPPPVKPPMAFLS